ncbi:MAG: alanyl-tRNA editing protein [Deltaproteobacteria bacterium]|nr:alanyl-tRNA editing protein [Deltaproteobacteria bacterium]
MCTEKIFWENPYLRELWVHITCVHGDTITVDRTIFYAASGGQDSDSGSIGGHRVVNAIKEDRQIFYTIEGPHSFKKDDYVFMEIDWKRRYRLMRLHFAAEIVLELVYQHFNRPLKIGANIHSDKARIDFVWDGNISQVFPIITRESMQMIEADLPIRSEFSDKDRELRYWEIDGFAKIPCGGTHIRTTGEIGDILLKRNNIGKQKERIEIYLSE